MVIEFVDHLPEPETLARHAENKEFADELRQRPNTYARYPRNLKSPSGFRSRINRGDTAAFGHGFKAEVRQGDVYIAYIGGEAS
ncbi:hypothetical protein [Rhodococcoides fascians]|uniref:hypothetical protein n=1 Tax=Rhodococcoides fascians TaxID=1828 RepID=UPI00055B2470|nr:hypothetical protein [Rhodococcus fascians]